MSQHITVLLAAYNGASYIEEQIRSILGQTLPPDQLLISDDGSTDGTVELLERLQAEYPSVLRLVAHKREGDYQDRWDQVPAPATVPATVSATVPVTVSATVPAAFAAFPPCFRASTPFIPSLRLISHRSAGHTTVR